MFTIENIIKSVRTILDHNVSSSQLTALQDEVGTLDLDTIIEDSIRTGAMMLMQMVPVEMADIKSVKKEAQAGMTPPVTITLPDDFLRFVSCNLNGWAYPVTEPAALGGREHLRQLGEFQGLKATKNSPVAVLDISSHALTMYGGGSTRLAECLYIGMPVMGKDSTGKDNIDIGSRLENPLCYIIAALACEVLKDTQKSQYLMQTARSLMTSAEGAEEQQIKANM